MARILDNLSPENQVGKQAREIFQSFQSMDVATGYFNLRGWSVFCDIVDNKINQQAPFPVARVLIGMAQGSAHEEILRAYQQEVDGEEDQGASRQIARSRKSELVSLMRDQLMRGVPTAQDRTVLARLYNQVKSGAVQLKVFCSQPLHGKTYIFHRNDITTPVMGLVGSSNLTYPGLTSNLELNTDVVDLDGARKLANWFEDRWNDHYALPISEEILQVLDNSWASPKNRDPYEVFLKVCYDLSKDVRDGLEEYSLTGRIAEELLDYQSTAVKTLARRIMTRGGTMLGDVVGLGKTLTAIAVALTLRDEHGFQPLVLCPKNLQKMWEDHLEAYELHGRVVPYSMSHKLEELRRYPFVIVDESHTLRNEETATYKDVKNYISTNDSKALLLTATPFNIEFSDVANQLGLFIDDDEDLGLQPLTALRKKDFADALEFGPSTLAAFRKSNEPEDWKRLMSEHLVRRTRSFIKNNYALADEHGRDYLTFASGERFYFPKRKAIPVDHQFTHDDPAEKMVDELTFQAISDLLLPRYDLHRYTSPTSKKTATKEELAILDDQKRSRGHATGLVRTSFYKRLSSCGHSFIASLQRHLSRNRLFLYCIDNDLPFPIGTIDSKVLRSDVDAEASEIEILSQPSITDPAIDYQLLQDRTPAGIRWLRPELFVSSLRDHICHDNAIIENLLERYGDWSAETDSTVKIGKSVV